MEHEHIDWNNIEWIFEEDDTYENINAPKWVDLSSPSETTDDEAWFCKPACKHPKCAEDYLKPRHYSKVKLLRSMTISEILPFKDRTRRDAKIKNGEKGLKSAENSNEDNENRNPNLSTPPLIVKTLPKKMAKKSSAEERTHMDGLKENSVKPDERRGLKSTFSARNLVAGRDILSHISEFCTELKKMARKGSKKETSEKSSNGVLGELKKRVRERDRMPLLVVEERNGK